MSQHENPGTTPPKSELRDSIREKVQAQIERLDSLVLLIGGQDATVEQVFPTEHLEQPGAARRDAPVPEWTPDQVAAARQTVHELGFGSEHDIASGLTGGSRIIEGGLAWKIAAELQAAQRDGNPDRLVFAGSANRKLNDDEHEFIKEIYGIALDAGATEYDFANFLARTTANNYSGKDGVVQGFGYELTDGNPTVYTSTGQLISMGHDDKGPEVLLLRIDREDYVEEETGKNKFRHQPGSLSLVSFISDVLTANGLPDEHVGLITSNAYASRHPDILRAGLKHDRQFGLTMYGRATMAAVRQKPLQPETQLNQLPGELGVLYRRYQKLLTELDQQ